MINDTSRCLRMSLLAGLFAAGLLTLPAQAQPDTPRKAAKAGLSQAAAPRPGNSSPYHPVSVTRHAQNRYLAVNGVADMKVRQTASKNLIRFSYRVSDPDRARQLGDKKATPYLIGQRSRAVLHVPVMDKIGQLRQTGKSEVGKEYWMVFSNKGNLIRAGDRVNVVIGNFHADGLLVE